MIWLVIVHLWRYLYRADRCDTSATQNSFLWNCSWKAKQDNPCYLKWFKTTEHRQITHVHKFNCLQHGFLRESDVKASVIIKGNAISVETKGVFSSSSSTGSSKLLSSSQCPVITSILILGILWVYSVPFLAVINIAFKLYTWKSIDFHSKKIRTHFSPTDQYTDYLRLS